ncbi:hypothetical protein ACOQFB_13315 [Anaeromyxobacter sp. Red801]|uniref:hypothetical protein n=1 Tax=Anaeromyxobacter sp. Red801 TaxID=3411632 RepID=UPI003B9E71B6
MSESTVSAAQGSALKYLACFGLEAQSPPEKAISFLLQAVLAQGRTSGMTPDAAAQALRAATGLTFDALELRRCAESDTSLGIRLMDAAPQVLVIGPAEREECLARLASAGSHDDTVLLEWSASVQADAPGGGTITPETLSADLKAFCSDVALSHGMETVALVYGDSAAAANFIRGIDEAIWTRIPERLPRYQRFCRERFPAFFLEAVGSRSVFIARMMDRTFELCRLSVAPEAGRLLKQTLGGLTAYLDTNVVFRLLGLHGPVPHLDVRRVIDLGKKVGAVARVTPRTLREFDSAAQRAIRDGRKFVSPAALLSISADLDDRQFFAEYHRLLARTPLMTQDLEASVRGVERTLEALGVKVWTEKTEPLNRDQSLYADHTRELYDYYVERDEKRPHEQRKGVSWDTAEHDGYHLALIDSMRPVRARTFGEAKFWFLTFHAGLARKAREFARRETLPQTILFDQWHQLLRSVLPRSDSFDSTFARNFYSPLFQGHRGSYVAAMEQIASRLANLKHLSSEHYAGILADAGFTARVAGMNVAPGAAGASERIDSAISDRLQQELRTEREARIQATKVASEEAGRAAEANARAKKDAENLASAASEVQSLSAELGRTRTEVDELRNAVERMRAEREARSERARRILRFVAGAAVALTPLAAWRWTVDGWSVRGTPINAVAATLVFVTVGLCIMWPRRTATIAAIGGVVVAGLQVGQWTKATSASGTPPAFQASESGGTSK